MSHVSYPLGRAVLLIPHPHDYREWNITSKDEVPGFYNLTSKLCLGRNFSNNRLEYTIFNICLHESEFVVVEGGLVQ
jgi:hypothetical protein